MIKTAKKYLDVEKKAPEHETAQAIYQYIVETYINGQRGQLAEMVKIMRRNGEISDFQTMIRNDELLSNEDKIELLIAMLP